MFVQGTPATDGANGNVIPLDRLTKQIAITNEKIELFSVTELSKNTSEMKSVKDYIKWLAADGLHDKRKTC